MKRNHSILKKGALLFLILCLLATAVSCNGTIEEPISLKGGDGGAGDGGGVWLDGYSDFYAMADAVRGGDGYVGKSSGDDPAIPGGEESGIPADAEPETEQNVIRSGQITVGAQDDNRYYDSWRKLFAAGDEQTEAGKFYKFLDNSWGLHTERRLTVTVLAGDAPVANALVSAKDADGTLLAGAVTNASGVAYLFPGVGAGTVTVQSGEATGSVSYDAESGELTVSLASANEKEDVIDLMFVIDVTGSMGDEIRYLQAELEDVINRVSAANANATVRLSLLFYRDHEDSVPLRYVDFRDVTDPANLTAQLAELAKERADGGGDYEEAVDEALLTAVGKGWSEKSTKLLFLVLDAPAHSGQEYESRYARAVREAAQKGIRICPILASGADEVCEYTTRSAAVLSGGTFLFITNHSGIGGDHYDPDLPNVTIEHLNDCLVRLINGYHTGTFADPVAWDAQAQTANS